MIFEIIDSVNTLTIPANTITIPANTIGDHIKAEVEFGIENFNTNIG